LPAGSPNRALTGILALNRPTQWNCCNIRSVAVGRWTVDRILVCFGRGRPVCSSSPCGRHNGDDGDMDVRPTRLGTGGGLVDSHSRFDEAEIRAAGHRLIALEADDPTLCVLECTEDAVFDGGGAPAVVGARIAARDGRIHACVGRRRQSDPFPPRDEATSRPSGSRHRGSAGARRASRRPSTQVVLTDADRAGHHLEVAAEGGAG
jgi:hypothetical protein